MTDGLRLYKFTWDTFYGELTGLFVASEEMVKNAIGYRLYFGEVLGKHSEVYGDLEENEIVELRVSQNAINELINMLDDDTFDYKHKYGQAHGYTICGYNPLEWIVCKKCHNSLIWDECSCND